MNISLVPSIIQKLDFKKQENAFFIKRDDLVPFSFGGNKARKALKFFYEILSGNYDTVVTYGSSSSNHCRVIANACAKYNLACFIVSPEENYVGTYNSSLVKKFGAEIIKAPKDKVSETIEALMNELRKKSKPFFIQGGGHGNLGTQAYVEAYNEICAYEKKNNIYFDYIFLASGTGTTQAGLICGAALNNDFNRNIIGISIARKNPSGKNVIEESVADYLGSIGYYGQIPKIVFDDSFVCNGYGKYNLQIQECINEIINKEGIPLDRTYTGKAFWGMCEFLNKSKTTGNNILFINTGGCPLFFDDLEVVK